MSGTIGAPAITIAGNTWDDDDCIQDASLSVDGTDVTYFCGGNTKHVIGSKNIVLTFTLALAATDTTHHTNLAVGTAGACEYHPGGDTATYIEHTTTNGSIQSIRESSAPNNVILLEVTCVWDDLTTGAAV